MKATVKVTKEIDAKYLVAEMAVRYDEEDIPNSFPFRHGNIWVAEIDIDEGRILGWPNQSGHLSMKVCDEGRYTLKDAERNTLAEFDGYVPNNLLPGEYGDYVDLQINESGVITNWPKYPSLKDFFPEDD